MIYINCYASISALGNTKDTIIKSLSSEKKAYLTARSDMINGGKTAYYGCVENCELPDISEYKEHNTRNNRFLAYLCEELKEQIKYFTDKYAPDRIGVVMGTSTSGLSESEEEIKRFKESNVRSDDYFYSFQEFGDPAMFLSEYLKISGPSYTISTACSSSSRALVSARRLIESGLCDVVIAGGADTLCTVPINGFNSMGLISSNPCTPFCEGRDGISIGEAGGLMVLSKEKSNLTLRGIGESSDAYHVSSPDPTGEGAVSAMKMALEDAKLTPSDIGYINLHGTATKLNDAMEAKAVASVFGDKVPCSSTKYMTGHTLGAAGILESCILCYILENNLTLPIQSTSIRNLDKELDDCGLITQRIKANKPYMMSNSFAFGGNNASVIIGLE
ncbi:3-oxoacyl-[acyl-carrier-protein] synthase-1 [Succinivibrio dextrinosolvens DSM 3072]|uniref:3-oxoacyl-[acyl-carrier-protein] synthase-1 n=1 Tax=Succinivibrio dextrinosolvens DSM 3072 TaxID=1123324 RepID=A0A1T4V6T9_9GAMM|nr:beta-ketoacyl-ACP synthase [Succinivibrio dextrinosolvens]SKA60636.1 3-oxoacyl-[acyl-carrier-protein] synthase-1 [Succinivibrio dextrinosolvens DSM 3072]